MTSVNSVRPAAPSPAPAPSTPAAPKVAAPAAAPATPAATLQLSQRAQALLRGDKDWKPGQRIDSF